MSSSTPRRSRRITMNPEDGSTPDFPSEIVEEIFLRLPVKSLCRLKCVSKPWKSFISSPSFAKRHFNYRKENGKHQAERLFFIAGNYDCYSLGMESLVTKPIWMCFPDGKRLATFKIIWNSCDGLILVTIYFSLFLVNPSTGECRELPPSPFKILSISARVYYGFGYEASIDDYKVVRICLDFESNEKVVSVYNLRTNLWRMIASSLKLLSSHKSSRRCFFFNGALHWVGETEVISFDLANESFHSMHFPHALEIVKLGSLYVLGDCLCGLGQGVNLNYGFDLWLLKDNRVWQTWVRLRVNHSNPFISWALPSLSGKVFMLQGGNRKITEYDPEMEQAVQLTKRGVGDADLDRTTYQKSLIRLKGF